MSNSVRRAQLATNKLNGHRNRLSELCVERGLYCSTASMLAFGVPSDISVKSRKTHEIMKMMKEAGYSVSRKALKPDTTYPGKNQRLGSFLDENREGHFLIQTRGHIMALRQGGLTDTDLPAGPHREVVQVWEVNGETEAKYTSDFVPMSAYGDR